MAKKTPKKTKPNKDVCTSCKGKAPYGCNYCNSGGLS